MMMQGDGAQFFALVKERNLALVNQRKSFIIYCTLRKNREDILQKIRTTPPMYEAGIKGMGVQAEKLEKQMIEARNHSINLLKTYCDLDERVVSLRIKTGFKEENVDKTKNNSTLPTQEESENVDEPIPDLKAVPRKSHSESFEEALNVGLGIFSGD